MSGTCTNITWLDGIVSSVYKVDRKEWMVGVDIKSENWSGKGGYRSKYICGNK